MSYKPNVNTNEEILYNYNKTLLGCTYLLDLNDFQELKINQFLGCIRKVKNNKINYIALHNKETEYKLNKRIIKKELSNTAVGTTVEACGGDVRPKSSKRVTSMNPKAVSVETRILVL